MKNLFPIFILLLFSCQNLFQNDKSQSLEEAYRFGAPSVEKYWDADDYEKFSNYLSKISEDALPLYKSKKSGELFNRLINSISQDVFEDQNISINEKMEIAVRFIDATGRIVKRYGFSIMKNVDYSSEFAHLLGIVLTNFNQINPLLNDFLKTIDKHDETYEIRMEGLDQFKNGVFKTIKGTLICLTEPHIYQKSDNNRQTSAWQNWFQKRIALLHGLLSILLCHLSIEPLLSYPRFFYP